MTNQIASRIDAISPGTHLTIPGEAPDHASRAPWLAPPAKARIKLARKVRQAISHHTDIVRSHVGSSSCMSPSDYDRSRKISRIHQLTWRYFSRSALMLRAGPL